MDHWRKIDYKMLRCDVIWISQFVMFRSSHRRCSVKKSVLKNFVNITGKQLCWSLLLIKLQPPGLQLY